MALNLHKKNLAALSLHIKKLMSLAKFNLFPKVLKDTVRFGLQPTPQGSEIIASVQQFGQLTPL